MKPIQLQRGAARDFETALLASLPPDVFASLFGDAHPAELPEFAAPEPSLGGALRLDNGTVTIISWGKASHQLAVELAPAVSFNRFLEEVRIPEDAITWRRPSNPSKATARHILRTHAVHAPPRAAAAKRDRPAPRRAARPPRAAKKK